MPPSDGKSHPITRETIKTAHQMSWKCKDNCIGVRNNSRLCWVTCGFVRVVAKPTERQTRNLQIFRSYNRKLWPSDLFLLTLSQVFLWLGYIPSPFLPVPQFVSWESKLRPILISRPRWVEVDFSSYPCGGVCARIQASCEMLDFLFLFLTLAP